MIERGGYPVEIFEEALAVGLDEIAGICGRVAARLENGKRIDPTFPDIDANAVATDLDEAGNVPIDGAVELRK